MCHKVPRTGRKVPSKLLLIRAYRYGIKRNIKKLNVKGYDVEQLKYS